MRIEVPVQWKIQGVHMGCFPACLAMLLSQPDHSYETWEVIERLLMPYRIEIEHNRVVAGSAVEDDSLTKKLLAHHFGFKLIIHQLRTPRELLKKALELLHHGKAFIVSITADGGGHGIVVYGFEKDHFMIHDPDNGVRYTWPVQITNYPTVPCQTFSAENMLKRIRKSSFGMFRLAHLERSGSSLERPPLPSQLLMDQDLTWDGRSHDVAIGIDALRIIRCNAKKWEEDLWNTIQIHEFRHIYYTYGMTILKPLTRNLYGALVASGIVHFEDFGRIRILKVVLKKLEQLFESYSTGLTQLKNEGNLKSKIIEEIIKGLDDLAELFVILAKYIYEDERMSAG